MASADHRARLRAILSGPKATLASSVWDPISARVGRDLGFDVGLMGGSLAAVAVLGAPDMILITLTELADQVRRAARADGVSVVVDADHGYGNALNVKRTIEELDNAGAAGVLIEDTLLPQPFGASKTDLIPLAEGVGKMKAAIAGRTDPNLVIFARTTTAAISIDDTIARVKAYQALDIDGLFLASTKSWEDLEAVAAVAEKPIMLGGVGDDMLDEDRLTANKVRVFARGHLAFPACVQAVHETLRQQRDGVARKDITGIADGGFVKKMLRDDDYQGWIKEFLS